MRKNIVDSGSEQLSYEIRGITEFAKKVESFGIPIIWENIGDPINKGEKIPTWLKDIVKDTIDEDSNWGYSPTKGLEKTREYISKKVNEKRKDKLDKDNIIFFNGLGDAISRIYSLLDKDARVIGPSPAYPTHSSAEGAHSGYTQLTYKLDVHNNWIVDLDDLRAKVKYNDMIVGILIINPDNPTGMVYPKETLFEIVKIAREYDLFLISDEIYSNLVYDEEIEMVSLSEVINGQVPTIVMKGISKDLPWPGSRCGWIEIYNKDRDENFAKFAKSIFDAKMLEVCSTTLPQAVIPKVFENENFWTYLKERKDNIKKRADFVHELFADVKGVIANKTYGAFYTSIVFEEGVLNEKQKLEIENSELKKYVEDKVQNISYDQRFVYYLLAKTGICIVPLSSFCTELLGFRVTFLETDWDKFVSTFETLKKEIIEYLKCTDR